MYTHGEERKRKAVHAWRGSWYSDNTKVTRKVEQAQALRVAEFQSAKRKGNQANGKNRVNLLVLITSLRLCFDTTCPTKDM